MNDEGSTAFNASKLPCIDQSAVMSFLAGGLRPSALAAHLRTGEIPADGLAGRTAALRSCCEELLTAVPVTVSSTFMRAQSTVLTTDAQHGHTPRLCTFTQVAYTCFLCAPGDATSTQPALGILRSDAVARDATAREGLLVRFSPGDRIVDVQFYRDARLVVLVCDEHGASRFDTIACDQLRYMPLDDTAGALTAGASLRAERLCKRPSTHHAARLVSLQHANRPRVSTLPAIWRASCWRAPCGSLVRMLSRRLFSAPSAAWRARLWTPLAVSS